MATIAEKRKALRKAMFICSACDEGDEAETPDEDLDVWLSTH